MYAVIIWTDCRPACRNGSTGRASARNDGIKTLPDRHVSASDPRNDGRDQPLPAMTDGMDYSSWQPILRSVDTFDLSRNKFTLSGTPGSLLKRLGKIKTSPEEAKTPPVKAKTSPAETKTLPVKAKTLPVEVKMLPVKAKTSPVETKNLPVKAKTLPVETKTLPVKVKTSPGEVKTPPSKSKLPPGLQVCRDSIIYHPIT